MKKVKCKLKNEEKKSTTKCEKEIIEVKKSPNNNNDKKVISIWLGPAHHQSMRCEIHFEKFGKEMKGKGINFIGSFDQNVVTDFDYKNCGLMWFPNSAGGGYTLGSKENDIIAKYIEESPNPTFLCTFLMHCNSAGNSYKNSILLPLFGFNKDLTLDITQRKGDTDEYIINDEFMNRKEIWEGTEFSGNNNTMPVTSYLYTQSPKNSNWQACMSDGAKIIASTKDHEAAIIYYFGTCPEIFGIKTKKKIRSMYITQMFEYSTDEKTHRLLYNLINFMARPPELWTIANHFQYSNLFQNQVRTILLLSQTNYQGKPWHSETKFYTLPRELLYLIFQYLAC
jgi:hypothetical protein